MMHTRRTFLAACSAAAGFAQTAASKMGVATTCYMTVRRPKDTLEFLEHCRGLGAGGIQASLSNTSPEYLKKLRTNLENYGMWMEVMAGLPRAGSEEAFARTLAAAREVGALCIRSACLGGRRYETFPTMEEWQKFVATSHAALAKAVPMAEKAGVTFAIENHKDWTVDELLAILKKYSSERFGVCLDTGNNISLLDDAMDVVERLAPYAVSTHIKDMALDEYPDGFLLAEVPLGTGYLDIPRMVRVIAAARPGTKMILEMITRDPLKVPCLTEKYWATFPQREGAKLAKMLRTVKEAKNPKPIAKLSTLPARTQWQLEEDNVVLCLKYARERLAL